MCSPSGPSRTVSGEALPNELPGHSLMGSCCALAEPHTRQNSSSAAEARMLCRLVRVVESSQPAGGECAEPLTHHRGEFRLVCMLQCIDELIVFSAHRPGQWSAAGENHEGEERSHQAIESFGQ